MPNYCENTLTLSCANSTRLQTFYDDNYESESQILSFDKLVPVPENEDNDSMWGTKWEAIRVSFEGQFTSFVYSFDTAWSPPLSWLQTVVRKYPDIRFELEFSESGCDFWGKYLYENGVNVSFEESTLGDYNWIHADKTILEAIIDTHRNAVIQAIQSGSEDIMTEVVEEIIQAFGMEDPYFENIHTYVVEFVEMWYNKYKTDPIHP